MEHVKSLEKRCGVDVGYHESSLESLNGVGRIGKRGIDKNFSLNQMLQLAFEVKANIIVKGGPNAKWYMKKINLTNLEEGIAKQAWRDTSRTTMWIINWDVEACTKNV
jgi:hypothetical protein